MPVHIVLLALEDAALLHSVGGGEFRLEHDRPAALDGAFIVRLCLLFVVGDELAVAEIFRGVHRLRRLFDDREAFLCVVGKGIVDAALKLLAAGFCDLAEQLALRVFLLSHERYPPSHSPPANIPSPMQPCRSIWLMGIRSQSLAPAVPRTRRKPSAAMMPQACRNLFRVMLVTSRCIRGRRCDLRSAPIRGHSLHCGRRKPRRRQGSCLHTERR